MHAFQFCTKENIVNLELFHGCSFDFYADGASGYSYFDLDPNVLGINSLEQFTKKPTFAHA